ncbi:MAG: hypothetical protein HYV09_38150 [Deltaproteobacteria bacterium]|nr:hypothetical protein [Deltaproteobacteria bacterium]
MRLTRFLSGTVALQLALAAASPTLAVADTKATAQKLFDEGAALMAKKDFAAACPKIKASMDLEPVDGTVLRLAVCYQGHGRWARAWGLFKESVVRAEKANRKDRLDMANKGIADVEKHMSYVTIAVNADARVPGLEVRLDDERVLEGGFGSAVPIDPGPHTVTATAAGKKSWESSFSIATTAENKTIAIPKLEDVPAPAVTTAAVPAAPAPVKDTPKEAPPTTTGSPTLAFVALGAGALFVGGAVVARVKMGSERDDYFDRCAQQPTFVCDDPEGRSRVRTWEALSWISGGIGLAAIGVGVTLLVTTPRGETKKTAVTASPATLAAGAPGLMISGAF